MLKNEFKIFSDAVLGWFSGLFSVDMGIDLGTCTTLVSARGRGIVLNEPSVVAIRKDNNKVLNNGEAVGTVLKRTVIVWVALVVSMTVGALFLMALGNECPVAGPFCLATYYKLQPVKETIRSRVTQAAERWGKIELYYSGTNNGSIASDGISNDSEQIDCHFVVGNGLGGGDGQIQKTEQWQNQRSVLAGDNEYYGGTIRICVIADKSERLTELQRKRAQALTEELLNRFEISIRAIGYPQDWN